MNNLSFDLLILIVAELDQSDIRQFRLASRLFARVGAERLNVNEIFYFRKDSLDRLYYLARHPVFCRKLWEIIFYVDVVPSFNSRETWESQSHAIYLPNESHGNSQLAHRWLAKYDPHQVVPIMQLEDDGLKLLGWELQLKIRREQEALLEESSLLKDLEHHLAMLPNLVAFSLRTFEPSVHKRTMQPLFALDVPQGLYCYNDTCDSEKSLDVARELTQTALVSRQANAHIANPLNLLDVFPEALTNTNLQPMDASYSEASLRQIEIVSLASWWCRDQFASDRIRNTDRPAHLPHSNGFTEEYWTKLELSLQQVLINFYSLQTLHLRFPINHNLNIQRVFRSCNWPHLMTLDLVSIVVDAPSFEVFLSLHAQSLQILHLADARLISNKVCAWVEFLKFSHENLHLSDIRLRGILRENISDTTTFKPWNAYSLEAGEFITVEDLARFLVCGQYPQKVTEKPLHPVRDGLLRLTWQDLHFGYAPDE